jgi:hypothetical protein
MTNPDGTPRGLQAILEECGFQVDKMHAKCKKACPIENTNCCMAQLLLKQDDFTNQISMLEELITAAGHLCIFLPKFHCELNPIEMVIYDSIYILLAMLTEVVVLGLGKILILRGH